MGMYKLVSEHMEKTIQVRVGVASYEHVDLKLEETEKLRGPFRQT